MNNDNELDGEEGYLIESDKHKYTFYPDKMVCITYENKTKVKIRLNESTGNYEWNHSNARWVTFLPLDKAIKEFFKLEISVEIDRILYEMGYKI